MKLLKNISEKIKRSYSGNHPSVRSGKRGALEFSGISK